MAEPYDESKFLRWQDMDRDGLIDECDDLIVEEVAACLNCSPNPKAVVEDWKKKSLEEDLIPFLNARTCHYQLVKITRYESTVPEEILQDENADRQEIIDALTSRFEEYVDEVIEAFLVTYGKKESKDSISKVKEALEYKKYWLSTRGRSRLKLLYSVPFDVIFDLPDAEEEEPEEEEDEPGTIWVHYEAADVSTKMIRIRKTLWLYARYLKAYRAMGEGNLFYTDGDRIFNLDMYGDFAMFTNPGTLGNMTTKLESFFNAQGMNLPGVEAKFGGGAFKDRIIKFKCKFKNYQLKTMAVWTESCGSKPTWFWGSKIKPLQVGPWRDKTAVAYFAQLYQMEASASARVQIPWQDYIIQYTYPEVYTSINNSEGDIEENVLSCVGEALGKEMKELGQDILDEVLSIGDVIAYQFNKQVCNYDFDELKAQENAMGIKFAGQPVNSGPMMSMAMMQAFKELNESDQVFTQMCAHVLANSIGWGSAMSKLDAIWEHGFEPLKLCGLFDLLMDAIKCLLGGLTLEEGLAIMVKSALEAMSIENFGSLFIGLPPEKQNELDAMVKKKLANNDMFGEGTTMQQVSDTIEGTLEWKKPWEDAETINQERAKVGPGADPNKPPPETRTLGQALDIRPGAGDVPADNVMSAYVGALLEVYGENLLALVDEINKFPGAQIITSIIASLECPIPPIMHPSLMDWIKDIGFFFCRNMNEVRMIRFEDPSAWFADIASWFKILMLIVKFTILQALLNIMFKILMKLCTILGDAICKALEVAGDIAASTPEMLSGRTTFGQVVKESICGPDADDERLQATIEDLFGRLGLGGAAFADPLMVQSLAEDISTTTTKTELAGAFLGEPTEEFLEVVDQLIEFEYPVARDALPNRDSLGKFFENVGNLMPADFRDQLRDTLNDIPPGYDQPVSPTICASEEQIENFRQLRENLLGGRASPDQAAEMFDDLRSGWMEDLGTLSSMAQEGIPQFVQTELETIFPGGVYNEPGCNNGMIPRDPPMAAAAMGAVSSAMLDALQKSYAEDLLGNGNIFNAQPSWGMMNEVLSDTEGNPLTAHHRKAWNRKAYVNFASNIPNGGEAASGLMSFFQRNAGFSRQHGQFPRYVGSWLMRQFLNAGNGSHPGGRDLGYAMELSDSIKFDYNNTWADDKKYYVDFDDLQANTLFGEAPMINILALPDFGYNTKLSVNADTEKVVITKKARKHTADVVLDYKDNAAGLRKGCGRGTNEGGDSVWSYGFEVKMWTSDIAEIENPIYKEVQEYDPEGELLPEDDMIFVGWEGTGVYANRADDNTRVKVVEKINTGADVESPLAELVGSKFEKSDGLDLPDWIEKIPIVGWALQGILNLLIKPFSSLMRQAAGAGGPGMGEDVVLKMRKYEFMAIDNGLDGFTDPESPLEWSDFPTLNAYLNSPAGPTVPQAVCLGEMVGMSATSAQSALNKFSEDLFKSFAKEIGENTSAWKYGADYDYLMPSDTDYVIPEGYDGAGGPYGSLQVEDADGGMREVENEDMIMGVSLNQYNNEKAGTPENTRVFYLDPGKFGGSFTNPTLYVKPLNYDGWLGLVQVLFPEYTPCKPHNVELVDFGEIEQANAQRKWKIVEDPRLKSEEECAFEVPYNRILERSAKGNIFAVIESAIRVYASVHFFKAMGVFSKIQPKFPENYSNIYSAYLVEVMEEGFKDAQGEFAEAFTPFKDEEFWYAFLEMCVQFYGWRVDNDEIPNPPSSVIAALQRLNNAQEAYDYPWRVDLQYAKASGEVSFFKTLKNYRNGKNLEAVKASEEDAKIIMKELVNEQLTKMGETLNKNLRAKGFIPTIFDLDYWLFSNHANGSSLQFHGPEFKEIVADLPDGSDPADIFTSFYTNGTELRVSIVNDEEIGYELGDAYIGYYHLRKDEWGDVTYVAGEMEDPEGADPPTQDVLRPIADKIQVGTIKVGKFTDPDNRNDVRYTHDVIKIGDLPEYGSAPGEDKMLTIEKYISINGVKMSPSAAMAQIKSNEPQALISHIYPGDMRTVTNSRGQVIGVEGDLGVRYGLDLSLNFDGVSSYITSVEVNALDLPCSAVAPFEGDSKLLLCLINNLKQDARYKLLTSYVLGLKKIPSMLAIYNDMGFLSAVGEVTVGRGDYNRFVPTSKLLSILPGVPNPDTRGDWIGSSDWRIQAKPGSMAFIAINERTESVEDPNWEGEMYDFTYKWADQEKSAVGGNEGWQHYRDRQPGLFGGIWIKEWDTWDRQILRKSKRTIKNIFNPLYNSRDFDPFGDTKRHKPMKLWINNLKARMFPSPGQGLLPWWRRGKIRGNPFNAEGNLCDGPD